MSRVLGGCRALMAASRAGTTEAAAARRGTRKAASAPAAEKSKTGLLKPVPVSLAMRKFLGVPEISRVDAVRKIWEHIRANQLQNPMNKREIHCDEKLKTIFDGRDKVGMLEIARLLSPHFLKSS